MPKGKVEAHRKEKAIAQNQTVLMQMLGLSNKEFRKKKNSEDYDLLRARINDFLGQMCAINKEMKTARKGRRKVLGIKVW